jgi:hypothetical protein
MKRIGVTMFITQLHITSSTCDGMYSSVEDWQRTEIAQMGLNDEGGLRDTVRTLAQTRDLIVDWQSWTHDNISRSGRVSLYLPGNRKDLGSVIVSWSYDELDDLDKAEHLFVPVDHRSYALGSLTPSQVSLFWMQVTPNFEPFGLFNDVARRMGLVPRDHDEADEQVLRFVLALHWWRAFPTVDAGEQALGLNPSLTGSVVADVMLMASLCLLEGQDYEVAPVLIHI